MQIGLVIVGDDIMKIAAAYIRVSTDMQTEYSPDSQIRLINEYAKLHGYVVPDEYIFNELGVSGKSADKRPEFQKMISLAKAKQFEVILVYHTNRFARNHEESIVYKSMLKRECDIEVISITQPPIDRKTDMLTNAIYSVMDEWYSIDLAANVKRGMTEKAMRGGYQCSPPFGYKIPVPKQPPVIVEEEAEIIRLIFDLYINKTTSIWNIAKTLSEMGYRTRKGNKWERRTVEYILRNPAYKGMAVWNKRNNNKSFNDPSKWIIRQGTHEPIISEDIFDKVQEIFNLNKTSRKAKPCGTYKHWLSGIFKCGNCNSSMTYNVQGYGNFGCNAYKKGLCTTCNSISRIKAENAINEIITTISEGAYSITLDQIVVKNDIADDIDMFDQQIARANKKLLRVKEAYSAGYDSLEEYGANKKIIIDEIAELENQKSQLKKQEADESVIPQIIENAKTIQSKLLDESLPINQKNELLKTVIDHIVYDKTKDIFKIYFSYAII